MRKEVRSTGIGLHCLVIVFADYWCCLPSCFHLLDLDLLSRAICVRCRYRCLLCMVLKSKSRCSPISFQCAILHRILSYHALQPLHCGGLTHAQHLHAWCCFSALYTAWAKPGISRRSFVLSSWLHVVMQREKGRMYYLNEKSTTTLSHLKVSSQFYHCMGAGLNSSWYSVIICALCWKGKVQVLWYTHRVESC